MPRRVNNTQRAPRRPQSCSKCTMFGHRPRTCHMNFIGYGGDIIYGGGRNGPPPEQIQEFNWRGLQVYAKDKWERHEARNQAWIRAGGAGHTVPEPLAPQLPERYRGVTALRTYRDRLLPSKTPFELACENKCKITETEDCCICMEKLGDKNTTTTACGHQFHFGCLAQHTRLSNSCPMCRTAICPEVPKRVLKLPPTDDVLRFAAGASAALGTAIGNMMSMDATQVEFVSEALGQVIADTNISLMRNIQRRNP